jgi:hypothetical protein
MSPLLWVGIGLVGVLGLVHGLCWWTRGRAVADRVFGWLGLAIGIGLIVANWALSVVLAEPHGQDVFLLGLGIGGWGRLMLEIGRLRRRIQELRAELEAARGPRLQQ